MTRLVTVVQSQFLTHLDGGTKVTDSWYDFLAPSMTLLYTLPSFVMIFILELSDPIDDSFYIYALNLIVPCRNPSPYPTRPRAVN